MKVAIEFGVALALTQHMDRLGSQIPMMNGYLARYL
jgi:hypothetical protein